MAKELIFRFKAESEVEALIDKLEEKVEVKKGSHDEGVGFGFRNEDRSLEGLVLPGQEGEFFEVIILARNNFLIDISKEIFGTPRKERSIAASILDVAELIAELPKKSTEKEIRQILKTRLDIDDKKYSSYKKIILRQAAKENTRDFLKKAAMRLK